MKADGEVRVPTFEQLFGTVPAVRSHAPGRVNLMGDHTDYNGGFVLPAAIPQSTRVELVPSAGRTVKVWSSAFPEESPAEYELGGEVPDGSWTDYIKGITAVLAGHGLSNGFSARIDSNVPSGTGLASSAALEIALGRVLRRAFGLVLTDVELARAARRAENEFVGAPVGIMDQMACSFASQAAPIFLDTRSLEFEHVPLPAGSALIVIDSGISHRHAGGAYGERRRECAEAAGLLRVAELRDTNEADLARASLPELLARRARHVLTENRRVHETVDALRRGDLERAGLLFAESHASMRDDFEVSVAAVDALVEMLSSAGGVYGARLTGGGFGGSVVALAKADRARPAADEVVRGYGEQTGSRVAVIVPGGAPPLATLPPNDG